ncbi:Vps5-domain-containing protein [Tothia fuscella]|uniref:Vps5-domain-containing protein n=1 Tax=Tothia fuscella TaxID=1048955 RepID=A0A9P4NRU6_9PEZI|nr:Vps5-domain-containing protein [Tothia fuscella]
MDLGNEGSSPWDDEPARGGDGQSVPKAAGGEEGEGRNTEDTTSASSPKQQSIAPTPTTPAPTSSTRTKGKRAPKRFVPQSTSLEAADDTLGPLGPLGTSQAEEASLPDPPIEHAAQSQTTPSASQGSLTSAMESAHLGEDNDDEDAPIRPRVPPPVQPPQSEGAGAHTGRQTQPSVSVVEAAKPSFQIQVGDPHKVGDLTSAHTEYSVYTKTTSKAYRNTEFVVSRRFRDFLWLFNQLHTNNPGIIVPPPPEKQAVGRFNADFVESRRQALERMLNKTAAHPTLQHDGDLKLFLESESFNVDIKHKERKEPLLGESKGMFSSIGIGGSSGGKFVEHDDWFHDRKIYLDALENQLKALQKATDTVVLQRKSLAEACGDFSASLHSLAAVELSPLLSGPLDGLSDLQLRIKELYDRQAMQDMLTLGIVIDEYIRLISSCKTAFTMRQRSYHTWHAAESDLAKRKQMQDKLLRGGRSQTDRLNQLGAEVADAEKRAHQQRLLFEDMGKVLRGELERFEREKVEEFKSGVETYLEGAVEAQKELIEIWETYLMRMDAEDDAATLVSEAAADGKDSEQPKTSGLGEDDRLEGQGDQGQPAPITGGAEEEQ